MDTSELPALAAAALADLCRTAQLQGAAIIGMGQDGPASVMVVGEGRGEAEAIGSAHDMLRRRPREPSFGIGPGRQPILVLPWTLHRNRPGALTLWRDPGATSWDARDAGMASAVAGLIRIILEQGPGEAAIDRLTGLPNRMYFLSEVNRHIDRLDQDGTSGTMLLVDTDGLREVNGRHGRAAGDDLLVRTAVRLRAAVRPSDLVCRVGGDEFAVWLDTMDGMTAAERAVQLVERRLNLREPRECGGVAPWADMPPADITLSVGIASRLTGGSEDARALLRRAHAALWEAKRTGGGDWALSRGPGA